MKNEDMELRLEELLALADEVQKNTLAIHEKYVKENAASFAEMRRVIQSANSELSAARKSARKELVLWCVGSALLAGLFVCVVTLLFVNKHTGRMYEILYAIYRFVAPAS